MGIMLCQFDLMPTLLIKSAIPQSSSYSVVLSRLGGGTEDRTYDFMVSSQTG